MNGTGNLTWKRLKSRWNEIATDMEGLQVQGTRIDVLC